jgi:phosphoglycolate phosphatase
MTLRPRRFDLIVFDWDGTLFDSTALIVRCIQAACRDIGVAVPSEQQAAYVIGLGLHDALQHAVPGLPRERYPELGQRYRHHYFARQHELVLFPGTLDMLHALKARNHWLAVATGKSRRGLDEALQTVMGSSESLPEDVGHRDSAAGQGAPSRPGLSLKQLFDGTRTADETAGKPNPLMLVQLMREFGCEPERTLMIGDTTHDLQMASNAGTSSVAVSFGAHDHAMFEDFAPLHVAHSTAELAQWLAEHA